jgi:hypothetical protein
MLLYTATMGRADVSAYLSWWIWLGAIKYLFFT